MFGYSVCRNKESAFDMRDLQDRSELMNHFLVLEHGTNLYVSVKNSSAI